MLDAMRSAAAAMPTPRGTRHAQQTAGNSPARLDANIWARKRRACAHQVLDDKSAGKRVFRACRARAAVAIQVSD